MFDFGDSQIRPELPAVFERAWEEIAGPGAWWTGEQRVAIAEATRRTFAGEDVSAATLPPEAIEAVRLLTVEPAKTNEAWVRSVADALGEGAYVELVGLNARVVAVDTFCRLTGHRLVEVPSARPGEPTREPMPQRAKRRNTWIPMVMVSPPMTLGAVPSAESAMHDMIFSLYMTGEQMANPDFTRGSLHRTQMELVAGTVSHVNECFF